MNIRVVLQKAEKEDVDLPPDLPLHPERHAIQRIPDLCPDDTHDTPPSGYHPSGVHPANCRCPECWTDADDAAWREEWRNAR